MMHYLKVLKKAKYNKKYMFNKSRNIEDLTKTELNRRIKFINVIELDFQRWGRGIWIVVKRIILLL